MSNATEKKYLGQAAAEKLIANTKDALNGKQPKGDYALKSEVEIRARIFFDETQPNGMTENDLWFEISDL